MLIIHKTEELELKALAFFGLFRWGFGGVFLFCFIFFLIVKCNEKIDAI